MRKIITIVAFLGLISVLNTSAQEIFRVIQQGDTARFEELLAEDRSLVDARDEHQELTPLHLASFFGHTKMMNLLIENGADVNSKNMYERGPMVFAIAGGHKEAVSILMEAGMYVSTLDDIQRTPLHWAAYYGNAYAAKALIENGALVNVVDNHARTPLFIASWGDHLEVVKLLLDNGANVDARYLGAASPLTTAAAANNSEVSKYLVQHNANIDLVCNMQVTPIYLFVRNNNPEMVDYLLQKGARVNYRDLAGRSPLYLAVKKGYVDIATKLMNYGADTKILDDSNGNNLLHVAAANGRDEIARLLIDRGVDVNAINFEGYSPLDYAGKYQHNNVYDLLESLGGKSNQLQDIREFSVQDIAIENEKEAYLVKLRDMTWGIRTKSGLMVFGYNETGNIPKNPSLANGCLTSPELKNTTVYHFDASMSGNNVLYEREKEYSDIHFICSQYFENRYNQQRPFEVKQIHFPQVLTPTKINNIEVTPLPAFRQHWRSYLVKADGLNIVWLYRHTDRYLPWEKNTEAIEYLKDQGIKVDLMLVGNTGADTGPEWISVMNEGYEMAKELNINFVFPVPSCKMGEYFYKERRRKGDGKNIHYANNPGDMFFYKNEVIEKIQ